MTTPASQAKGSDSDSDSDRPEELTTITEYRLSRLRETLLFLAEKSPYYGKLLEQLDVSDPDPDSILRSLPAMSSAEWGANRVSLRTGPVSGVAIGYTGGTTTRTGTPILSVDRELTLTPGDAARTGLGLALINPNAHGMAAMTGYGENVIVHGLGSPEHYEQAMHLLDGRIEPFASMPQISQIDSSGFLIKALSLYLLRHRGRMDDLGVSRIFVGRNLLSPRWRTRLENWWGAVVTPVYGFSEMRMCNAHECGYCGYYHLPVTGLAEVLRDEPDGSRVLPGERGSLAVTGFYPFIQLEPRIRYMPGDIAELSPSACPHWGEHGFRPLGRRVDSVRSSIDGTWICPVDVYAPISDHPYANRGVPRTRYGEDRLFDECFAPRFRLEPGDPIKLHVELRFLPSVWVAEWSAMRDSISRQLAKEFEIIGHEPYQLEVRARC